MSETAQPAAAAMAKLRDLLDALVAVRTAQLELATVRDPEHADIGTRRWYGLRNEAERKLAQAQEREAKIEEAARELVNAKPQPATAPYSGEPTAVEMRDRATRRLLTLLERYPPTGSGRFVIIEAAEKLGGWLDPKQAFRIADQPATEAPPVTTSGDKLPDGRFYDERGWRCTHCGGAQRVTYGGVNRLCPACNGTGTEHWDESEMVKAQPVTVTSGAGWPSADMAWRKERARTATPTPSDDRARCLAEIEAALGDWNYDGEVADNVQTVLWNLGAVVAGGDEGTGSDAAIDWVGAVQDRLAAKLRTAAPTQQATPSGERELWREYASLLWYAMNNPGGVGEATSGRGADLRKLLGVFVAIGHGSHFDCESTNEPAAARTVEPQAPGASERRRAEIRRETVDSINYGQPADIAHEIEREQLAALPPPEEPMARVEARTGLPAVDPAVEAQLMRIEGFRADAEYALTGRDPRRYVVLAPAEALELCDLAREAAQARACDEAVDRLVERVVSEMPSGPWELLERARALHIGDPLAWEAETAAGEREEARQWDEDLERALEARACATTEGDE